MAEAVPDINEFMKFFMNSMHLLQSNPQAVSYNSPLHDAVRSGKLDIVRNLINGGESVNATDASGRTALHFAEITGNTEMAECLVGLGADMTLNDSMGMDPFFHAVTGKNYNMVKCLARLGADVNTYDQFTSCTPLHRAVSQNMFDMVELLAELGADVNAKERGLFQQSPIRYVLTGNNTKMIELLAKLGANLDQVDSIGVTTIAAAASEGKWEMVESLAHLGADLDPAGMTALSLAINRGFADAVSMLIKCGAKLNRTDLSFPLMCRAISNHDERTIALLLDGGMRPDLERRNGMTPLYFSATLGNGSATNLLLNAGVDANFMTGKGMNALHGSCMYGQIDIARLLLLAGTDINQNDSTGMTPLDYLPFQHLVDYSLEHRWRECKNLVETAPLNMTPKVTCPPLERLHTIPGLGNVLSIPGGLANRVFADVKGLIEKIPTMSTSNLFSGVKLQQVGSSGEETRTGLPNEMDFVFQVDLGMDNRAVKEVGYGYAFFAYPADAGKAYAFLTGSKSFHDIFNDLLIDFNETSRGSKITFMEGTAEEVKDADRKACTPMMLCWKDDGGKDKVAVSVDAVPCIHINDWPENGTRKTWLMDYDLLKKRGYNLIPKSPNIKSEMARGFSPQDLREMWRISFSHLETEHMYKVEPRVKAVYVTAKCLRNPDICQILIRDKGSHLKTSESYLVSYLLKMMFFQRAEEFMSTDQSLGRMVVQLFEDVEHGLTNDFIPLFFMPSVNVLDGLKLDVRKCAAVARIMSRFVRSLYSRDQQGDTSDLPEGSEVYSMVYQRDSSLYKVYDVGHIGRSTETGKEILKNKAATGDSADQNPSNDTAELSNVNRQLESNQEDDAVESIDVAYGNLVSSMCGMLNEVAESSLSLSEVSNIIESRRPIVDRFGKSVKKFSGSNSQ